ncbi:MAG TPA: asparaginase [Candidatus Sulfotelmatobacter sp.]|nr:asparaginase [Candidatus Sulfotelmatobacter sp.]
MTPRVAVLFSGGTISMAHDPAAGGAVPTLDGAAILARTDGLPAIAQVVALDWGRVPASHLSLDQVIDQGARLRDALADPDVVGAVVVQGTDVMEETVLAFDLLVPGPKPVVVTGAMRHSGEDGYDGPQNLRDAVRTVADPAARGMGAAIVMAGLVLPADDVVKVDTAAYAAFACPDDGPLGHVSDAGLRLTRTRARRRELPKLPAAAATVELVLVGMGGDGTLLRAAVAAGARGIVVAATGSGNTAPDVLAAAVEAMAAGVPVVLASRVLAGGVRPAYAFPGGGATWAQAGALMAGTLGAAKARVVLALALGAGLDGARLQDLFEA